MKIRQLFIAAALILITIKLEAQTFMSATGGTVTTQGNYKIHTFTSNGTFNITTLGDIGTVEVLVVGGGGGGGAHSGGGGGGGGVIHNSNFTVTATSYSVTIGAGGLGGADPVTCGTNGGNSIFSSLTAIGGGTGGLRDQSSCYSGSNGGSGGGAGSNMGTGGTATAGQGYAGGIGQNAVGNPDDAYSGGGGGGAGAAGANGNLSHAGNGGDGLGFNILGTTIYYGGGGGGGVLIGTGNGAGGLGGGGAGGHQYGNPVSGSANSGGGGGGGNINAPYAGADGGSGVVIIRYQYLGTISSGGNTPEQWIVASNNIYYDAGAVGIGTGADQMGGSEYKLFVRKGIRTEKLKVDIPNTSWPDFVFDKSYKLSSLSETEKFIKHNNHLPGMPSAKEVERNGVDVGTNQALLLKKIEELTLILIQQNKKIEVQDKKIEVQDKTIYQLQKDLKNLKK